jgi:hypothetical protein
MPKGYRKDGLVALPTQGNRKKKTIPRPEGRGRAKNPPGIHPRHLKVIDAYEKLNFSSQRAALLMCGYSESTATTGASSVFLRPDVREEIEKRKERRRKKLEVNEDLLVQRLGWLITANPGEIIQKLRENDYDLSVLTEEEKYAVGELAQIDTSTDNTTTTRYKVKLESALAAIDKMMRKLGLYKDKVEHTMPGMSIVELLEQGRQRVAVKPAIDPAIGEKADADASE